MRKILTVLLVFPVGLLLGSCGEERPGDPDGNNVLTLVAMDTSGVSSEEWLPVPGATVKLSSTTFYYQETFETDDEGRVVIAGLPAGNYTIMAEKINVEENVLIIGQMTKQLLYDPAATDTVLMSYMQASPIVINEVYYCGCNASSYYYYDQFFELYNSSSDTLYLDGYIMCRSTQIQLLDWESVDYAIAYFVYIFPGTRGVTKECPIPPKGFLVLAGDAYDHSLVSGRCVDLSSADWEFCNPVKFDYDNPSVPNIDPVTLWSRDFTINIAHVAIWLATGEGYYFDFHFDGNNMKEYINVPLETIVDAVEYSSNPDSPKYVTIRIDAGLGGNGMTRYSARSIERRYPGLDSNNSTFDFVIVDTPTPGYQH
ncbi:MAG: DUF4876 domain-containing protein [Candidatus Krumholzibacteria bacterium]|nr:DUF4876 domain-containing protein [Candidatus Krumholzibacteria bacterium]